MKKSLSKSMMKKNILPISKSELIEGKYGYIEFMDKRKFKDDGYDDAIEPEIRKPTPFEREEIILNFIRDNSGKSIKVTYLADKLAVSDRTIQKTIRKFEEQKLIKILPCFTHAIINKVILLNI